MSYDDARNSTDRDGAEVPLDHHYRERTAQQEASDIRLTQVARRYDNMRTVLAAVALLVATSCLLIIITLLLRINDLAEETRLRGIENQQLIKSTQATLHLVEDCTNPAGECSQRGRKSTGAAIQRINQVTIASNWCSLQFGNRTYEQVQACVVKRVGQ